jgi:hypothetical protein
VAQLVQALCGKVTVSIPSGRAVTLGSNEPPTEMSTSYSSCEGKSGRCVELTSLPPSCANCHKNWELRPHGTLRACPGIALPYVIHRRKVTIKNHSNTSSDVTQKRRLLMVDCVWNVMAHAQKTNFVFRRKGRVHLNRRGCQFSRLLAAEVCASAVIMLDTSSSEVVKGTCYPLHSPVSPSVPLPCVPSCAITFQLNSNHGDL